MVLIASLTSPCSVVRADRTSCSSRVPCTLTPRRRHRATHACKTGVAFASTESDAGKAEKKATPSSSSSRGHKQNPLEKMADTLGVGLGPIAMSYQDDAEGERRQKEDTNKGGGLGQMVESAGLSLGPIALSLGEAAVEREKEGEGATANRSIAPMTTEAWRNDNENEEGVDLWLEDHFNAPSRFQGGVDLGKNVVNIENKAMVGQDRNPDAVVYKIKITDPVTGDVLDVECPDDRYILFEAEEQGLTLPNMCRNGCCTACAVKVKKGALYQPEALGVSKELQQQGYALLCTAYPDSDLEVELQDPDEVYQMQFGKAFEEQATSKDGDSILRDDFALEIADMDE